MQEPVHILNFLQHPTSITFEQRKNIQHTLYLKNVVIECIDDYLKINAEHMTHSHIPKLLILLNDFQYDNNLIISKTQKHLSNLSPFLVSDIQLDLTSNRLIIEYEDPEIKEQLHVIHTLQAENNIWNKIESSLLLKSADVKEYISLSRDEKINNRDIKRSLLKILEASELYEHCSLLLQKQT